MERRIQIVEDERITAEDIKYSLEKNGYSVTSISATGEQAVKNARSESPDLILMDIMLRGEMSGIQAAESIMPLGIPVIYLTAYSDNEILKKAENTSPWGYLIKPFEEKELVSNIEIALLKHESEKKISYINSLLNSLRRINQLITKEKDGKELTDKICENLTINSDYIAVWSAVFDDKSGDIFFSEAGCRDNLPEIYAKIKDKNIPEFVRNFLASDKTILTPIPENNKSAPADEQSLPYLYLKLLYEGRLYGFIAIYFNPSHRLQEEEINLLEEISGDIAFALNKISLSIEKEEIDQQLNRQNVFLKSILDSLAFPLQVINPFNYEIIISNKAVKKIPGAGVSKCYHYMYGFDKPCHNFNLPCPLEKIRESGKAEYFEHLYKTQSGGEFYYEVQAFPVYGNKNEVMYIIEYFKDITDKRAFQERIKYQAGLLNNVNDAIIATDENYIITSWNRAAEHLYGYSEMEATGKPLGEIFGENIFMEESIKILREKGIWKGDLVQFNRDGKKLFIRISVSAIKNNSGEITGTIAICSDVSGEKLSEIRFNNLIDKSNDAIYILYDGSFDLVNKKFESLFGYKAEELRTPGFSFMNLVHPESRKIIEERAGRINNGETLPDIYEFTAISKNGKAIDCEVSISYVEYKGARASQGIIRDITERNLIQKELRLNEERYRSIFETAANLITSVNRNGIVHDCNCRIKNILHYEREEVIGQAISKLIYPELITTVEKFLDETLSGGHSGSIESRMVRKDGKIIDVIINASAISEGNGHFTKIICIIDDVTERNEAVAALRESEERFRSLYENAPIGIYRMTSEGDILMANPAFLEMLGYASLEQITRMDKNERGFAEPVKRAEFKRIIEDEGIIYGYEDTWLTRSGEQVLIEESGRVIFDTAGSIIYYEGVVEDITLRKAAEKALIVAKESAEQSDRLKSEFLAQMSHEIRTPLNAMLSFTGLLKAEMDLTENKDQQDMFLAIDDAGKRIIRTIDLILNMSEVQTGNYDFSPARYEIYTDIINVLYPEFRNISESKGIEFNITRDIKNAYVYIDEYSMIQVFRHLIDNAFKFTNEGIVEVRIYRDEKNRVAVEVKDTGIGISDDFLKNIFKPFTQEEQGYSRKYEGNGLGLSLVKKYCEINNTELNVKSKKFAGSIFTVIFNI